MEHVQKLSEEKRFRRNDSLKSREDLAEQQSEKAEEAKRVREAWDKVLSVLTSSNRPAKQEGTTWLQFFTGLIGHEMPPDHVPPVFLQESAEDLTFQKVILRLRSYIEIWTKKQETHENYANREKHLLERSKKYHARVEETKKRKVEDAFRQEEHDQVAKKMSRKSPDLMCG